MRALLVVGVVFVAVGAVWIGHGVGAIGGSFMTGQAVWAVIGAFTVLFGAAFVRGAHRGRNGREP